jgi:LysR family transcriptional regulator, hydrogen peroxide-inducible genes activator
MADIKLKDLRYLVALAETRHFGKAAAKCFVSQPTLSAQLKKLEEYLGSALIERQPNNVTLTEMGERVVERARRMLSDSDEIVELAHHGRDPLMGSLRLALIPTIGPYLLPLVAGKARKQLPRLKLMLYEYQTDALLERLKSGDIDVGILALPVSVDGFATRTLYEEPFTVAMPTNHRLAKRASVRLQDLAGEKLLLLEDGHCLRDQALEVCGPIGLHENDDYRATSLETLRQMVAAGHGITLLPALAAATSHGDYRSLAVRPFTKPVPKRVVGAVWRTSSTRVAAIAALCELITQTMHRKR